MAETATTVARVPGSRPRWFLVVVDNRPILFNFTKILFFESFLFLALGKVLVKSWCNLIFVVVVQLFVRTNVGLTLV